MMLSKKFLLIALFAAAAVSAQSSDEPNWDSNWGDSTDTSGPMTKPGGGAVDMPPPKMEPPTMDHPPMMDHPMDENENDHYNPYDHGDDDYHRPRPHHRRRRHRRQRHHRRRPRGHAGDEDEDDHCDRDVSPEHESHNAYPEVSPSHENKGYGGVSPDHESNAYPEMKPMNVSPDHENKGYGGVSPDHESSAYPEYKPMNVSPSSESAYGSGNGDGGSCPKDGDMVCSGQGFNTCDHGSYVYRACAPGTACKSSPDTMILCDYA